LPGRRSRLQFVRHRLTLFAERLDELAKRFGTPDFVVLEFVREDFMGKKAKAEYLNFQRQRAKDRAGMFLVMGVAAALGFHVLVNVAMVIGAMPVTGIPLPLMSYGGSATLFVFLAIGLVMNVRLRRFVN
jgi:hypothetical protein